MFQAQNRETLKFIMTASVTRPCFTTQHQTCTKTKTKDQDQDQDRFFWSETGLFLRPTVPDHITDIQMTVAQSNAIWWRRFSVWPNYILRTALDLPICYFQAEVTGDSVRKAMLSQQVQLQTSGDCSSNLVLLHL